MSHNDDIITVPLSRSVVMMAVLLNQPSAFRPHRTRPEMKYCSGGFHGSDNLFGNMQVSGGGAEAERGRVFTFLTSELFQLVKVGDPVWGGFVAPSRPQFVVGAETTTKRPDCWIIECS